MEVTQITNDKLYLIQTFCCTENISFMICTNSLQHIQAHKKGQFATTTTLFVGVIAHTFVTQM